MWSLTMTTTRPGSAMSNLECAISYVRSSHVSLKYQGIMYEEDVFQGMEDTIWRVGCYKINPTTPSGQKFFILHMLVLPLIPITALVIQNGVTMNNLMGYSSRVSTIRKQVQGAMEIALFIQNIQEGRAEVALYIFTSKSGANFNMSEVQTNKNRWTGILKQCLL